MTKCAWANSSELLKKYHDEEWGKPIHNDQQLFEMLILENMSCGLSWEIILKKRQHMRYVFDNFDPQKIAQYSDEKIDELMQDSEIVRNRAKLSAMIQNAKAYLILTQNRSFNNFLWEYVNYEPIRNISPEIVTHNEISNKLSRDLKKLDFKFIGTVITYSFMQAVGMINDHDEFCAIQ